MGNYWEERSKARLVNSEKIGLQAMRSILKVYEQALRNINAEINDLYVKYATESGLDVMELSRVLSGVDKNNFIKSISGIMKNLGFNVSDIYNKNYIARLTRLEALKQQVYWEIRDIAYQETRISTGSYSRIIQESYSTAVVDIREKMGGNGIQSSFSTIDAGVVRSMLQENWKGGNYSSRIWGNTTVLNDQVQRIIGGGITSGISQEKMATQLDDRFRVGKYNTMRLVRTETNYFQNQAELQSFKDEDIQYYQYSAILDGRTSEICQNMDGKIFRVDEAIVGVNYPPLHVNCRSSAEVIFPNEVQDKKVYTEKEARDIVAESM